MDVVCLSDVCVCMWCVWVSVSDCVCMGMCDVCMSVVCLGDARVCDVCACVPCVMCVFTCACDACVHVCACMCDVCMRVVCLGDVYVSACVCVQPPGAEPAHCSIIHEHLDEQTFSLLSLLKRNRQLRMTFPPKL